MWPLGHAAVAYIAYALVTRKRYDAPPGDVAIWVLVVGSQFPDLVDKPLAWYVGVLPTGRTLAHSLLVVVPLSLAVFVLASHYDRGEYGVAFAVGVISHVILDALPALWGASDAASHLLWPLTPVEAYESGSPSVLELLRDSFGDAYFLSEFGFAIVAMVLWSRHGYPGLAPLRALVSARE